MRRTGATHLGNGGKIGPVVIDHTGHLTDDLFGLPAATMMIVCAGDYSDWHPDSDYEHQSADYTRGMIDRYNRKWKETANIGHWDYAYNAGWDRMDGVLR